MHSDRRNLSVAQLNTSLPAGGRIRPSLSHYLFLALGLGIGTAAQALTLAPGDAIVADDGSSAATAGMVQASVANGNRASLTGDGAGSGTALNTPQFAVVSPLGTVYYYETQGAFANSIVSVDPGSGARVVVSNASTGSGTAFVAVSGLAWDSANSTLIVSDAGTSASTSGIISVDPVSGNRTFITGNGVGTGAALDTPMFVTADPAGNIYYFETAASGTANGIVQVSFGIRTLISGGSGPIGGGAAFVAVTGMAWDATTSKLLVSDGGTSSSNSGIVGIDPANGNRIFITGNGTGFGASLDIPEFVAVGSNGTIYYVEEDASGTAQSVITVNPTTGERVVFSGGLMGSGTAFVAINGLAVAAGAPTPVINSAATASADDGLAFSYFIAGTNSPTSYSITTGTLPTGLMLNASSGQINGSPLQTGLFNLTIGATNSAGTGTGSLALTVNSDLAIAPAALAAATAGTATNKTITVSGGTTPYATLTVTAFSGGGTGLTAAALTANSAAGTVTLSGTPTAAGTVTFTVNAIDAAGAVLTKTYTVSVVAKATAGLTLGNLNPTYDGTPKLATITTVPPGLAVLYTYNGVPLAIAPAGGSIANYSAAVGQTLYLSVTGAASGTVYGGDGTAGGIYGINSDVPTAAVHAGILTPGQSAVLQVNILADQGSYTGVLENGVTSLSEGAAAGAFQIVGIATTGFTNGPVAPGAYTVVATIWDTNYQGTATGTLTIAQATPTSTWATPGAIPFGTALSAAQLNATASANGSALAGTGVSKPAAGTVLATGGQTLTVAFTPTDAVDYTTASASVTLTVSAAAPVISWVGPGPITYGTALTSAQLNATASYGGNPVAGTFAYNPGSGAFLAAGLQTLSVTFTPADTADFATVAGSTTIAVNQATPAIVWAPPASITFGTALSGTQLNAMAVGNGVTVIGTYIYTPPGGTVLNGGPQSLGVSFVSTDPNYTGAMGSVSLLVNAASQTISFPGAGGAQIGVPVVLSASASSGLPVTFALVSGNATLVGSTLTLSDGNPVMVSASQAGNANFQPASVTSTITAGVKLAQTINFPAIPQHYTNDDPFQLTATASSGLPVTYSMVSGPATISGSTLILGGTAGTVTVQASQPGDSSYQAAPPATVSFAVVTPVFYCFFGTTSAQNGMSAADGTGPVQLDGTKAQSDTSTDNIAATLSADGKSGVLIGYLPGTGQGFVVSLAPDSNGNFSVSTTTLAGTGSPVVLTITGSATLNGIGGTIQPLGFTFGAAPDPLTGPTASLSGFFTTSNVDGSSGSTYAVIGTQGDVFVLAVTPTVVAAGLGSVNPNTNSFNVQASTAAVAVAGTVSPAAYSLTGTVTTPSAGTVSYSGVSAAVNAPQVWPNLSARGVVAPGIPLIVGFVINGTVPKTVVLRGVGPGLIPLRGQQCLGQPDPDTL